MLPLWEEVLWPFLDALDSVRLRTTSSPWNVPGRYGSYGELFFFPFEETADGPQGAGFGLGPASQLKQVKACALVGLHMMAEEDSWRMVEQLG